MKWILDRDFEQVIRREIRQIVQQNNETTLEDAVETAIELASGYFRHRYDTSLIFTDIALFNSANVANYVKDQVVRTSKDVLYVAQQDTPSTSLTDATWKQTDPRNKALVQKIIDITLYDLHSSVSPHNIPALRVKRYDSAIKWLEMVQKDLITPNLPQLGETPNTSFRLSTSNKTAERW